MREIKPILSIELLGHYKNNNIAKNDPYEIDTFNSLVKLVAELSYLNKDYLLFYRGQAKDYLNSFNSTTIYPSIYRKHRITPQEIQTQFELLDQLSIKLCDKVAYKRINGYSELRKKKYIQWSIIQHYELWDTPLLDVTQSLRVACSFAQLDNISESAIIYILGLPYLTNRISINSEHDLVNIRLLSICPPSALRPYYQEGFLIGTTDITYDFENKSELDFNKRLIAKIKIPNNKSFWGKNNSIITKELLFPEKDDFKSICLETKQEMEFDLDTSDYGSFIKEWLNLEKIINNKYYQYSKNNKRVTMNQIIEDLYIKNILSKKEVNQINNLRFLRNDLIHQDLSKKVIKDEIKEITELISSINDKIIKK